MFGNRQQTYEADGVARYSLPDGWHPQGPERQGVWSAFVFSKGQSGYWGAGSPNEVHGFVITTSAEATVEDLESAMAHCFAEIQVHSQRFSEFGNMKTGSRTTWMSEGSYQISPGHDPEKVLFLRSIDPVKMAALVVRVHLRKYKHEKLREVEQAFFGSFTYLDGRAKHFASQPRPALAGVNRALRARGLEPATSERPVAMNGWIYYLAGDQFVIGRRLDRQAEGPDVGWLKFTGSKWESGGAKVPDRWAYKLALDADRTKAYYFRMLHCDLESQCDLERWMASVDR
jgi:hypothetical protein